MSYVFYLNHMLLINHGSNQKTDHVKQFADRIVALYNKDNENIGYNILNYQDDSLKPGLIIYPSAKLENEVNEILNKQGLPSIKLQGMESLVVGKVLTCVEHPDSDHLHITTVDVKDEVLQIVCGAKNIAAGQKVVVAKVGTMMFDGTFIEPSLLRNVSSCGMICSGFELKLDGYKPKTGILVLDDSYQIGNPYFDKE